MLSPARTLLVVSFLDMLCIGVLVPQLHRQAQSLGCSHLLTGIIGATYSATQLISGPIIGNLSDMKGRKLILLVTIAICGVAYLLLGTTTSIAIFFTLRLILGIFKQTQLLIKSMAPDYLHGSSENSAIFGKLATLTGIGMTLGPIASGHIVDSYPDTGFQIITCFIAITYIVNIFLVNLLPDTGIPIDHSHDESKPKKNTTAPAFTELIRSSVYESLGEFKKVNWAVYWDVFLYKLILTLCMGMYFSNFSIFLRTKHEVSLKNLGYVIAFQGGIGSICTYFIDYINRFYKEDSDASKRTLHMFIAMTFSFIAMGLAPNIYFYILFVTPLAVSGSVARVCNLEMTVNKGYDEHRGSVMGATSSVRSLSGIVTPILVGAICEFVGVNYVIFFAAVFSAVGVVVSYKIRSQTLLEKVKSE